MIGRLSGVLLSKAPPQVLIDVAGVGYEVDVPMSTFYDLPPAGDRVVLLTHMVVREDAQLLYGFLTESERAAFRELIRISGIGPRMALAVLSGLSVADLAQAVTLQESGRLVKVPGIGKKTAERLLVELRNRLDLPMLDALAPAGGAGQGMGVVSSVREALIGLGYGPDEARDVLRELPASDDAGVMLRDALKLLGAKRA